MNGGLSCVAPGSDEGPVFLRQRPPRGLFTPPPALFGVFLAVLRRRFGSLVQHPTTSNCTRLRECYAFLLDFESPVAPDLTRTGV